MTDHFTWIKIYKELATTLLAWENKQAELIAFLDGLHKEGYVVSSVQDKNRDGERFLLTEIDPFTFFGVFNRQITDENRRAILAQMKQYFQLQAPLPADFSGIPVVNNQSSWFFAYHASRKSGDIPHLWHLFQMALQDTPLKNPQFLQAFDEALTISRININLTMGLFWIRPDTFLGLDKKNRTYLGIELPKGGLTARFYAEVVERFAAGERPFLELSFLAEQASRNTATEVENIDPTPLIQKDYTYWLVGAYWNDRDPRDQTTRFLEEGVWENGYPDRYLDDVKSMQVNDKIAIKAATTQRKNLPFEAQDRTVSRMDIKAVGTIVANRGDGRAIEVEWEPDFEEKSWYFYTNRNTVWRLRTDNNYNLRQYSEKLIDFVWGNKGQDYDWFCKQWWGENEGKPSLQDDPETSLPPYSIEDIIAAGVFLAEKQIQTILDRLRAKKAMILQGVPGVGKTFIARKLAYALMEEVDPARLEMVQFHQSYSYDDFVRGYRPLPGQAGSFGLQNGVFYDFCHRAAQDPDREYVFIIDEINRGNLSQIFGELLMLIEADKRGREFAVPLVYRHQEAAKSGMSTTVDSTVTAAAQITAYGIPIRNLWHMLLYAWGETPRLPYWQMVDVEKSPSLDALLTSILIRLVQQRLRIGLGCSYMAEQQTLRGIRGRVQFTKSLKQQKFARGQAVCAFENYSINAPKNQIIRSTLFHLAQSGQFGPDQAKADELRHALRWLARTLDGIALIELTPDFIHRQQAERHDRDYRIMLAICDLILQKQMPTEDAGHIYLSPLERERLVLHKLYEAFVANFYRHHLRGWAVMRQKTLTWHEKSPNHYLPMMRPDLVIKEKSTGRLVVLDTKFTAKSLVENRWGKEMFHSAHLYQIYAYLRTQEHLSESHQQARGILLYPAVRDELSEQVELPTHKIYIECVNLAAPWQTIEQRLWDVIIDGV